MMIGMIMMMMVIVTILSTNIRIVAKLAELKIKDKTFTKT